MKILSVASAAIIFQITSAFSTPPVVAPIGLSWNPSSDPLVTGYNIYYGPGTRNYTNMVPVGSANSVSVSNLVSGTTYYFAATSYTLAGLESDYSAEALYTAPTNAVLSAKVGSGTTWNLTVSGFLGANYQIQYATNLGPATVWLPLRTYTQTNFVQTFNLAPTTRQAFFRVQQQ